MIDTKITIEQCVRCGELTWGCYDGGQRVSAEPGAISIERYRQNLINDRRMFAIVQNAAGKPTYLVSLLLTDRFQPERIVEAHACGKVKHWSKSVTTTPGIASSSGSAPRDADPKALAEQLGSPEAIRLWMRSQTPIVGGNLSAMSGGTSPLTTPVRSTAHAEDKLDISRLSEAERLLRDHLGAHPDRGVRR